MMSKKSDYILMVSQRSTHRVTGLSIAFETLIGGMQSRSIPIEIVDTSSGVSNSRSRNLASGRVFSQLLVLLKIASKISRAKFMYLTIGNTPLGVYRDLLAVLISSAFGKLSILHLHGGGYDSLYENSNVTTRYAIKSLIKRAHKIVVLGELLKDQFSFAGPECMKKIVAAANGLPLDINFASEPKRLPTDNSPIKLLYLSNLIPSKGYLSLVRAIPEIKAKSQIAIECHLCGDFISTGVGNDISSVEDLRQDFFQLLDELHVSKQVKYLGPVSGEEKREILAASHIFVLPTNYPGEGQPISIIEALAVGMPVVSTQYRGIPELVDHRVNGLLVSSVTPSTIANAVIEITNDRLRYNEMSKTCIEKASESLSSDAFVARLLTIFGEHRV